MVELLYGQMALHLSDIALVVQLGMRSVKMPFVPDDALISSVFTDTIAHNILS